MQWADDGAEQEAIPRLSAPCSLPNGYCGWILVVNRLSECQFAAPQGEHRSAHVRQSGPVL